MRFDVPGTGGSPASLLPLRFTAHAWLVAEMLNRLDYQQVDVPGLSWGGAPAQQFAFQLIRHSRLHIFPDGHLGLATRPELTGIIHEFLAEEPA